MSDSWWAKKLGQQGPAGIRVAPPEPVHQQPQQQQVVHQQQQAVTPQPQNIGQMKYTQVAQEHEGEKISKYWQGGEGMKKEGHLSCPGCGSTTGYTEYSNTHGIGGRPGPHCFECGYNGRFVQGLQASWA